MIQNKFLLNELLYICKIISKFVIFNGLLLHSRENIAL